MSEIEKMYLLAGIRKGRMSDEDCVDYCLDYECKNCRYSGYPPFTAEKQINLTQKLWELKPNVYPNFDLLANYSYSEMIAELANHLWQDLTEEEKQQIKGILE